uniref:Uncharacterized protein n=1 Tax=Trichobilharzia regenti TaxID=157069 RepID=A0AA85KDC7_TRIRE|nr:unnamed protein product [Trichobilharzia regenti]
MPVKPNCVRERWFLGWWVPSSFANCLHFRVYSMEPYNPRIPPEDSDESEADLRVISEEEFLMLVLEEILRLNPVLPSTGWIYRTIMLEEQIEDVGPRTRTL